MGVRRHSAGGLVVLWSAVTMLIIPGCGMFGGGGGPVVVAEREDGAPITWSGLDALTRAFADRQVGMLYSVTHELAHGDSSAEQRRIARTLLADGATNLYNIASDENVFNRVLDFAVVTALLHRQWGEQGRAGEVFGERGGTLVGALADMAADGRALAGRVLGDEQLEVLDRLVASWHDRNPRVGEVSFVRFAEFARGGDRPEAENLLGLGAMLFAQIGDAGEAVDDAARVADRALFRAERAGTLLRWQAAAAKADALATPQVADALGQVGGLGERLDALPGDLGAELRGVLASLDDRLPAIDATVTNTRGLIGEADTLVNSVEGAGESVRRAANAGAALMDSFDGTEDLTKYQQAAGSVGDAAARVEAAAESIGGLLGSPGTQQGVDGLAQTVDARIVAASDAADGLIDRVFWRLAALLGILFVLLAVYRAFSIWMLRRYGSGGTHRAVARPFRDPAAGGNR